MEVKIKKDCEFRGVQYEKGKTYTVEGKVYRVLKMWKAISKPTKASKEKDILEESAPSLDN